MTSVARYFGELALLSGSSGMRKATVKCVRWPLLQSSISFLHYSFNRTCMLAMNVAEHDEAKTARFVAAKTTGVGPCGHPNAEVKPGMLLSIDRPAFKRLLGKAEKFLAERAKKVYTSRRALALTITF